MSESTAREIMTTDVVTAASDLPVKEAARILAGHGFSALPIVDDGALVGLVTDGDLIMKDVKVRFPHYIQLLDAYLFLPSEERRMETELRKQVAATVADVMTTELVTASPDTTVSDLATTIVERNVSHVPIVDASGALIGIVSKSDIVRCLAES
jgi:CBS domain-containing protein